MCLFTKMCMLALAVSFPKAENVMTASGVVNSLPGLSVQEKVCGLIPVRKRVWPNGLFSTTSLWFPE